MTSQSTFARLVEQCAKLRTELGFVLIIVLAAGVLQSWLYGALHDASTSTFALTLSAAGWAPFFIVGAAALWRRWRRYLATTLALMLLTNLVAYGWIVVIAPDAQSALQLWTIPIGTLGLVLPLGIVGQYVWHRYRVRRD